VSPRVRQRAAAPDAQEIPKRRDTPTGSDSRVGASGDANGDPSVPGLTAKYLLTAEQLAERWQCRPAFIWRLARRKEIPTVRIGRYVRFRLESIESWERAQEVQSDE